MTSTLTSKGQVTIPMPLRDAWNLQQGDKVSFSIVTQGILVQRLSRPVESLRKILPRSNKKLTIEQMEAAIKSRECQ